MESPSTHAPTIICHCVCVRVRVSALRHKLNKRKSHYSINIKLNHKLFSRWVRKRAAACSANGWIACWVYGGCKEVKIVKKTFISLNKFIRRIHNVTRKMIQLKSQFTSILIVFRWCTNFMINAMVFFFWIKHNVQNIHVHCSMTMTKWKLYL